MSINKQTNKQSEEAEWNASHKKRKKKKNEVLGTQHEVKNVQSRK